MREFVNVVEKERTRKRDSSKRTDGIQFIKEVVDPEKRRNANQCSTQEETGN